MAEVSTTPDKITSRENVKQRDPQQQLRKAKKTTLDKRKPKTSEKKLLLPQVVGIRWISDDVFELITEGGSINVEGEFWSTEKLTDELYYCLATKEPEPQLVTISCANDENSCGKSIDLMEHYESKNTLLYRKYIIRAEKLVGAYCEGKPTIFVINLADLTERLQAELIDLMTANSKRTLSHVLHLAVARVFALASLAWFYESAREEIEVVLQP
jgi:hypothetical protein